MINGSKNISVNQREHDGSYRLQCACYVPYFTFSLSHHLSVVSSGKFNLAITTEIILEYEEIITQKYGIGTAKIFMALLSELPNIQRLDTYYHWQLITEDPDDNKYCDCAVASRAHYIVTEDKHFNVLHNVPFPKLHTLPIDSFAALL